MLQLFLATSLGSFSFLCPGAGVWDRALLCNPGVVIPSPSFQTKPTSVAGQAWRVVLTASCLLGAEFIAGLVFLPKKNTVWV